MLFLPYAAPEVVLSWRDGQEAFVADPATDVWSLGVIFYELLTQQRYFLDATDEKHVAAMLLGEQPLPHEQRAAAGRNSSLGVLRKCVSSCLCVHCGVIRESCARHARVAAGNLCAPAPHTVHAHASMGHMQVGAVDAVAVAGGAPHTRRAAGQVGADRTDGGRRRRE